MLMSKEEQTQFAVESREEVISSCPFRVRRVARWSECDPAGVVYTGNFTEYMLSATHLFRRHVFGGTWKEIRGQVGIDTPNKALSIVFNGSLWPDDIFDIEVQVGGIRNRTFDFEVAAFRADDGSSVFTGTLSAICVKADDRRIAVPIPEPLRQQLEDSRLSYGKPSKEAHKRGLPR
jgi:acyl-CoA thioesterase FadM